MKTFIATLLMVGAASVYGQFTIDVTTGAIKCDTPNTSFCLGTVLLTNIILRCGADKVGRPGNCNEILAGVPPVGVKLDASCYKSSRLAGDAVCSFKCVGYGGPNGTFPIPGCPSKPSPAHAEACGPTPSFA
ncbi:MAG: hypothetical protein M1826_006635 [Phylliscum demangeonii]|nr:MAG: hypothetical protein M1826_006635 [Phylliscum demangeonii]